MEMPAWISPICMPFPVGFFGTLGIWPGGGMIGSIVVAFVGAVLLVWITRLPKRA
jgi:uncharacterized membrane protein YeaQ/YmgE (transglycosylase-associated protein family)